MGAKRSIGRVVRGWLDGLKFDSFLINIEVFFNKTYFFSHVDVWLRNLYLCCEIGN